jgi:hypothetical protein
MSVYKKRNGLDWPAEHPDVFIDLACAKHWKRLRRRRLPQSEAHMGNGQDFLDAQIEEAGDEGFAHGLCMGIIIGAIIAGAGTTYCFYAHFGPVIHAAQKAGATIQQVEAAEHHIVDANELIKHHIPGVGKMVEGLKP